MVALCAILLVATFFHKTVEFGVFLYIPQNSINASQPEKLQWFARLLMFRVFRSQNWEHIVDAMKSQLTSAIEHSIFFRAIWRKRQKCGRNSFCRNALDQNTHNAMYAPHNGDVSLGFATFVRVSTICASAKYDYGEVIYKIAFHKHE